MNTVWTALAKPYAALTLALGYCACHLLFRLASSPDFNADEAEIYVLAQNWQFYYDLRHPPLLIWLARALLILSGENPAALFVLKYSLMAAGLAAYTAIATTTLRDARFALLSLLGLLVTPTFLFGIHFSLFFAVLLGAAVSLSIWLLLRALEHGRTFDYVALGFAIALGFWSKYIFIIPFLAFGLSVALLPDLRRRVASAKAALALAIPAILCAPIAWVLIRSDYSMFRLSQRVVLEPYPSAHPGAVFDSFFQAVVAGGEFVAPLAVLAVFFPPRGMRVVAESGVLPWGRLLLIANLVGALIMICGDAAIGIPGFKFNWMYPVLLALPIVLLRAVQMTMPPDSRLKMLTVFMAALVLMSTPLVFLQFEFGLNACSACNAFWPAAGFAQRISDIGFERGTIHAADYFIGGNLQRHFRDSNVVIAQPGPPIYGPLRPVASQELVVWRERRPAEVPFSGSFDPGRVIRAGQFTVPLEKSKTRSAVLHYVLLRAPH